MQVIEAALNKRDGLKEPLMKEKVLEELEQLKHENKAGNNGMFLEMDLLRTVRKEQKVSVE